MSTQNSYPERWFKLLCLFPVVTAVCVYAEAVFAWAFLGHWPRPSFNDPKSLSTAPIHWLSTLFVFLAYPAAIFLIAVAVKNWRVVRVARIYWPWLIFFTVTFVALETVGHYDPGQVWYWWWD